MVFIGLMLVLKAYKAYKAYKEYREQQGLKELLAHREQQELKV